LNKKTAILGAGGAARAVAYVLAKERADMVAIFDIDRAKSAGIVEMVKSLFPQFNIFAVDSIEQLAIKEKDLLVNATPIGLKDSDPVIIKEDALHSELLFMI